MADVSILDPAVSAVPKGYLVKGAQEIVVRSVTGTFDGSAAASTFIPAVQIVDPSGFVAGTYPYSTALAAGASADISFFPGLGGTTTSTGTTGVGTAATVRLTGNYTVTTGDPGTIINWTGTVADTGTPTPFWSASHPARLTAPVDGWYLSTIRLIWDRLNETNGEFASYLYKNTETVTLAGSFGKEAENPIGPTSNHFTYAGHTHGVFYLNAGDYLIINAYCNTGDGGGVPATINILDNNTSVPAIPGEFSFWSLSFLGGTVGPTGATGPQGGGLATVEDGITTVTNANTLDFTSGATVTNLGGGVAGVAIAAGSSTGLLAVVQNTTGGNKTTTSASLADIDATNAAITFTAPASGNVLVRLTAEGTTNANQNAFLGLRESTTNIAGPFFAWNTDAAGTVYDCVSSVVFYLTGISAGSHTYKAAFSVNGAATMTVRQAATTPLTLEVWAAP